MLKKNDNFQIDNTSIKEFINYLFNSDDIINITRLQEPENKDENRVKGSKNFKISGFPNIKNIENQGIFFGINPLNPGSRRTQANLACIQTIFIDFDNKKINLKDFKVEPNVICTRGEKNTHIYYKISQEISSEENIFKYKAILNYFIANFGADKQVKNPAGLARLPGTLRYKTIDKSIYTFEILNDKTYRLDDLIKLFEIKLDIEQIKNENITDKKNKIENFNAIQYIIERHKKLYNLNKYETGTDDTEETLYLYRLGLECRDWNLSNEKALEIAFELNTIIFEPFVKDHIIKHQINSAYRYAKTEAGTRLKEFEEQNNLKEQKKALAIFHEEEKIREKLKNYCFILGPMILLNKNKIGEQYSGADHCKVFLSGIIHTTLSLNHIIRKGLIQLADKMDFRPDINKKEFYDETGAFVLNRFQGIPFSSEKDKDKKGVELFLNHIKYLTTSDYEYKTLLSYIAHKLQKPFIKIPYAPLLINRETGSGRSWLAELLNEFFGQYMGNVTHENLKFGYTQYKVDKLFIAMHEIKDNEKYSLFEALKTHITDKEFLVDEKYSRSYWMTDFINYIFFSNHIDALRIDNTDRRLFTVLNDKLPNDENYYNNLYGILNNKKQLSAIFYYLMNFDLKEYNPFKRPEMTEGKKLMIETTANELTLYLNEMRIDNDLFKNDFILIRDIQNYVQMHGSELIKRKVSEKQIKLYLIQNKYYEIDINRTINGERIHRRGWVLDKGKKISNDAIIKTLGLDIEENKAEKY